jgi:hypothetical protein
MAGQIWNERVATQLHGLMTGDGEDFLEITVF